MSDFIIFFSPCDAAEAANGEVELRHVFPHLFACEGCDASCGADRPLPPRMGGVSLAAGAVMEKPELLR